MEAEGMTAAGIQRLLTNELQGFTCRCGRAKKPAQTFCRPCFMVLPHLQRRALYKTLGNGYEAAYFAAVEVLAEKNRMHVPDWITATAEKQ
jgi:hypothetical protein